MFRAPPDVEGTPMERFEKVLKRVIVAPKLPRDPTPRGKKKAKRRI
jgi:hypothetical protein